MTDATKTAPAFTTIDVACRVEGYAVPDGNTWWYLIASYPWSKRFYVTADAFFNGDDGADSLSGTPFVDAKVPLC